MKKSSRSVPEEIKSVAYFLFILLFDRYEADYELTTECMLDLVRKGFSKAYRKKPSRQVAVRILARILADRAHDQLGQLGLLSVKEGETDRVMHDVVWEMLVEFCDYYNLELYVGPAYKKKNYRYLGSEMMRLWAKYSGKPMKLLKIAVRRLSAEFDDECTAGGFCYEPDIPKIEAMFLKHSANSKWTKTSLHPNPT